MSREKMKLFHPWKFKTLISIILRLFLQVKKILLTLEYSSYMIAVMDKYINKLIKEYGIKGTAELLSVTDRYVKMIKAGRKPSDTVTKLIKYVAIYGPLK